MMASIRSLWFNNLELIGKPHCKFVKNIKNAINLVLNKINYSLMKSYLVCTK